MNATDNQSAITKTELYLNGTLARNGQGALNVPDTTLTPGTYTVLGRATSTGGTEENAATCTVAAPQITITSANITPTVLQGDSAFVSAAATTNNGIVTLKATYNGQTIAQKTNNLYAELQATHPTPPTITATSGTTTVTAPTTWNYTPLSITATPNNTTANIGQTINIPYNTQTEADSSGTILSDGRRIISNGGGNKTAIIPILAAGTVTATPITYNGKPAINATGTPIPLTGTALLGTLQIRAIDVEGGTAGRYNIKIDGQTINLPSDTTITRLQGNITIAAPTNDATIEPLIAVYEKNDIQAMIDSTRPYNLNLGPTQKTIDIEVIKKGKPHFTGLARAVTLSIYRGGADRFHPVGPGDFHVWIRRTPYVTERGNLCETMPPSEIPNFYTAAQELINQDTDTRGRRHRNYIIHTEEMPDNILGWRSSVPDESEPSSFGPLAKNIVLCSRPAAAGGSAWYSTNGLYDGFLSITGGGLGAIAELLDVIDETYSSREDNDNTDVTRHNSQGGGGPRKPADELMYNVFYNLEKAAAKGLPLSVLK